MKKLLLVFAAVAIPGCASYFTRQSCDKINWFKHGEAIAMRGEWLNADSTLNECRKAEAAISESQLDQGFKSGREKYCTSANSYLVGRAGDTFSKDLCDSPSLSNLISQYGKGLRDYCAKSNGFEAGVSGKKYQNNCPNDLVAGFLPEYKRGRLKFVQAQIQNLENRKRDNELAIANKNAQLANARANLKILESRRNWLETQRSFAATSNPTQLGMLDGQINSVTSEINVAHGDVNRANGELQNFEQDQQKIAKDIADYRTEMAGL
ncbi:MAG: DUF2799 domain-containing protein [Bdellovibrio sp.]|nr:DUF2799 domain-containing protein [Bdellovibrio sp.]